MARSSDASREGFVPEALLVVTALAFLLGGYEIWHYQSSESSSAQSIVSGAENKLALDKPSQAELQQQLAAALLSLSNRSQALSELKADFPSSPELNALVEKQYTAAQDAVLNIDPTLAELSKTDPAGTASLNALRASLASLFAAWQAALNQVPPASTLTLSLQVLSDMNAEQEYIHELDDYVNSLTPANSGLTGDQIIALENETTAAAVGVNDAETGVDRDVGAPAIADNSNSSQNNEDNTASSTQTVVTIGDIVDAENNVAAASSEVSDIQNQIQNNQDDSSSDTNSNNNNSDNGSGSSNDTSPNSDQSDQTGGGSTNDQSDQPPAQNPDYDPNNPYGIPPPQGPAASGPTLIQGTNSF